MSGSARVAMSTAFLGFVAMVLLMTLQVQSPVVVNILWPTHFLERAGEGGGAMKLLIGQTVGFFGNVLLYWILGFVVGRLIYGKGESR